MGVNSLTRWGFLAAALLVVFEVRASVRIEIDTGALGLNGSNWDLAFDLVNANPAPNSARISDFSITGGGLTQAASYPFTVGNVTGNLSVPPGVVTLDDSTPQTEFFNEYLDNANLGTLISFVLDLTDNMATGFDPDTFALFFVNPANGATFPTTDPTGADALFIFSLGLADQPATFCPITAARCIVVTPVAAAAPEPGALALVLVALLALTAARSRARRYSLNKARGA